MVVKYYHLACAPSTDGMVEQVNQLIEEAKKENREVELGVLTSAAYFKKHISFTCEKCKKQLTRDKIEETNCDQCKAFISKEFLSSSGTTFTQQKGVLFMKEVLIYESPDIRR